MNGVYIVAYKCEVEASQFDVPATPFPGDEFGFEMAIVVVIIVVVVAMGSFVGGTAVHVASVKSTAVLFGRYNVHYTHVVDFWKFPRANLMRMRWRYQSSQ